MKQTGKLLLASLLAIMMVLPFVMAAGPWFGGGWSLGYIFGTDAAGNVSEFLVFLAVWMIIFVGSADIFRTFTMLSPWACWVIGLGVAIIAANVGLIATLGLWLFGTVAVMGTIGIAIILGGAFVMAVVMHLLFWRLGFSFKTMKERQKAEQGAEDMAQAIKGLKRTAKELRR